MNRFYILILLITLSISCSRTKKIVSPYSPSPINIDGTLTNWPQNTLSAKSSDEFDYFTAYDDEFFYLYVAFKNNAYYRNVQRYGLNIYFDTDKKFRRSFGITYPVGILNELSNIPGARLEYLQNPGWSNRPENQRLLTQIEEDMPNRAMIMQRAHKKAPIRPGLVSLAQINAQGIEIAIDRTGRIMNIEMKVPLKSSRIRQFAIDPASNQTFYLGFEVMPPSIEEITGDPANMMSPTMAGADRPGRYGRDPYRQQPQNDELTLRLRSQLIGESKRWIRVNLSQ